MKKQFARPRAISLRHIPKTLLFGRPWTVCKTLPAIYRAIPYTTLRYTALMQMYDFIEHADAQRVSGSIVEMGCGRGGCSAFMAYSTEKHGSFRDVWMLDSFQGLSEPTDEDWKGNMKEPDRVQKGYLAVDQRAAEEAVRNMNLRKPENVHIVPGWFEDSLPRVKEEIGTIAVLRLDADIYEPTKYALEELYQHVAPGGFIVFDDFKNWIGCRRALYEFAYTHDINPYLQSGPYGSRTFFQKPQK